MGIPSDRKDVRLNVIYDRNIGRSTLDRGVRKGKTRRAYRSCSVVLLRFDQDPWRSGSVLLYLVRSVQSLLLVLESVVLGILNLHLEFDLKSFAWKFIISAAGSLADEEVRDLQLEKLASSGRAVREQEESVFTLSTDRASFTHSTTPGDIAPESIASTVRFAFCTNCLCFSALLLDTLWNDSSALWKSVEIFCCSCLCCLCDRPNLIHYQLSLNVRRRDGTHIRRWKFPIR